MLSRFNTFPHRFVVSPTRFVLCLLVVALLFPKAYAQNTPAPTHLTTAVGQGPLTLTWDGVPLGPPPPGGSNFTGYYNVYRATSRGAQGMKPYTQTGRRNAYGTERVRFTDTHVSPGKTYFYQVTSVTVTTVNFPNFPIKTYTSESARSAEIKAAPQKPARPN